MKRIGKKSVQLVVRNWFTKTSLFLIEDSPSVFARLAGLLLRNIQPEFQQDRCPRFENIVLQQMTRSREKECDNCYLCRKGSSTIHKKIITGRGHKRKFESCAGTNENSISKRPDSSKKYVTSVFRKLVKAFVTHVSMPKR